jgi:DHA2 family multidrug resistance protein
LSQAVLLSIKPPERHGQAMAIWGTGAMIGPIAGPALGGWLTDTYNLALGVLHQPAGRHHCLPRNPFFHSREPSRPPDAAGAIIETLAPAQTPDA